MYDEHSVIFRGDFLTCQACGAIVWSTDPIKKVYYYRTIIAAYKAHARKCLALRKRLVLDRRRAIAEAIIKNDYLPFIDKVFQRMEKSR